MTLTEENSQVLNLVQAMVGAVTPNLRRATLEISSPGKICLRFLLELDDPDDREELGDVAFEFEALQDHGVDIEMRIIVDARPIHEISLPGRVFFGRKE